MNSLMNFLWQETPPLWAIIIVPVMIIILGVVCFWLTWRRMSAHHTAKMKQSIDLMVDQQEINAMIAEAVTKVNELNALTLRDQVALTAEGVRKQAETDAENVRQRVVDQAAAVREQVVEEAEGVRAEVVSAAARAEDGFVAGAIGVNEKLDVLVNKGSEGIHTKLDALMSTAAEAENVDAAEISLQRIEKNTAAIEKNTASNKADTAKNTADVKALKKKS